MKFFDLTEQDSIDQIEHDLDHGIIGYETYLQRVQNINQGGN